MCFIQKEVRRCVLGLGVVSSKNGKWCMSVLLYERKLSIESRSWELGDCKLQVTSYYVERLQLDFMILVVVL